MVIRMIKNFPVRLPIMALKKVDTQIHFHVSLIADDYKRLQSPDDRCL
jgi:hypothetical protein